MCIVIVKKQDIDIPSEDILRNCFTHNPDGSGYMYIRNGKVNIRKGFMKFKGLKKALRHENFNKDDIVIYHFRIKTHGSKSQSNCHPFPVSSKTEDLKSLSIIADYGIAHNGMIDIKEDTPDILSIDNISDTMIFIKDILSNPSIIDNIYSNTAIQQLVLKFTEGSKIALLSKEGKILMLGGFIDDKDTGLLFSNDSYKQAVTKFSFSNLWEYDFKYNYSYEKDLKEDKEYYIQKGLCPRCNDLLIEYDGRDALQCISCGHIVNIKKDFLSSYYDF